jgi:MerR family transcriptional regulator, copper efflux regulator
MQISELAQLTGVTVHALRHYEALGMISSMRRLNGYREYAESTRREVVFIAMSRSIGFSLKTIAEQIPAYRSGRLSIKQMVEVMNSRVSEIDQEIKSLTELRSKVISHIAWLEEKNHKPKITSTWPLLNKSKSAKSKP